MLQSEKKSVMDFVGGGRGDLENLAEYVLEFRPHFANCTLLLRPVILFIWQRENHHHLLPTVGLFKPFKMGTVDLRSTSKWGWARLSPICTGL